jgi:hypothetical protein
MMTLPAVSLDGGFEPSTVAKMSAGFPSSVSIAPPLAQKYAIRIARNDDSAALADGDSYSLTVAQGAASLLTWSSPVTYVETFPDGQPCDAVPCRRATVTAAP